jgi:hypothetical protein
VRVSPRVSMSLSTLGDSQSLFAIRCDRYGGVMPWKEAQSVSTVVE